MISTFCYILKFGARCIRSLYPCTLFQFCDFYILVHFDVFCRFWNFCVFSSPSPALSVFSTLSLRFSTLVENPPGVRKLIFAFFIDFLVLQMEARLYIVYVLLTLCYLLQAFQIFVFHTFGTFVRFSHFWEICTILPDFHTFCRFSQIWKIFTDFTHLHNFRRFSRFS